MTNYQTYEAVMLETMRQLNGGGGNCQALVAAGFNHVCQDCEEQALNPKQ